MAYITKKSVKGIDAYRITVYLESLGKKKVRRSTTFYPSEKAASKIQREVELFAYNFEKKTKAEYLTEKNDILFSSLFKKWTATYGEMFLSARILENTKRIVGKYFLPSFENRYINSISTSDIQEKITEMLNLGLKKDTVKKYFCIFRQIMDFGVRMNLLEKNPCSDCFLPRNQGEAAKEMNVLSINNINTFLNLALEKEYSIVHQEHTKKQSDGKIGSVAAYEQKFKVELQWKAFFNLSVFSGLRPAEILALTWNDVDFESGKINVNKALSYTAEKGAFLKSPKTRAGIRHVYVPKEVISLLKALLREEESVNGDPKNLSDCFIFHGKNGKPMNVSTPAHKLKKIIRLYNSTVESDAEKLPDIRLYDLRHTYATLLISNGHNIEAVARAMGHSDVAVTLNIYGHAFEDDLQKMASISSLLKQAV